jgi:hypothetical protein
MNDSHMEHTTQYIGTLDYDVRDVADEYQRLAMEDEEVGRFLLAQHKYRHAVYCFVQAMEKYVRFKIFTLVNADLEYFRNRTRTHNVDDLLSFLVEIVSANPLIQEQIHNQLERFVLEGVRFGKLHNDLRYPVYMERSQTYARLQVDKNDAELALQKLEKLKMFLRDIDRLKSI